MIGSIVFAIMYLYFLYILIVEPFLYFWKGSYAPLSFSISRGEESLFESVVKMVCCLFLTLNFFFPSILPDLPFGKGSNIVAGFFFFSLFFFTISSTILRWIFSYRYYRETGNSKAIKVAWKYTGLMFGITFFFLWLLLF